jgi:type I restriction enzyme S subunit
VRADGQPIGASDRTITSLGLAKSSANLLPAGAVLLTTRASVGFTAIAAVPLATNQGFQSLIPGADLHPDFLMLWIQANREEFRSRAGGSTFPEVSKVKVRQIPITIPPLEVQRRIVDLLAAVDDHIARLRGEALSMSGVAEARRTHLPPGGEVPLGTVLEGIDSGRSLGLNGSDEHPTMRVLMLSAVRPAAFNPREVKPLPADASMPDDARVREGDLLITRSNTPERVGYACRARGVQPGTYMPDLIWRLRPTPACDADYLEQALASPLMRGRVAGSAGGTSQSMRKINKAGLRALLLPLPSLDEQRAFAADCAALADQSQALAREAEGLTILRRQLLSGLLSRKVEIPDAYDQLADAVVA